MVNFILVVKTKTKMKIILVINYYKYSKTNVEIIKKCVLHQGGTDR